MRLAGTRARLGLLATAVLVITVLTASAQAVFGALDPSFGGDGKVTTDGPASERDEAYGVAIQPDGKIVVPGIVESGSNLDLAVARYNANGSLDAGFDGDSGMGNGIVTTPIGTGTDFAGDVAIQDDGKIVVAGSASSAGDEDVAVVRFNPDGTLDDAGGGSDFGGDGIVTTPVAPAAGDDGADAVAIQSDDKLVVAGSADMGGTTDFDFALLRYNPDGTLDDAGGGTDFGGDGIVTTDFTGDGNEDFAIGMTIQPDTKIVAVGSAGTAGDDDFALARYHRDGSLDTDADTDPGTHFDVDGVATTSFGSVSDRAHAVGIQSDGRIVAAGTGANEFALARYDASNGSLDAGFDGEPGNAGGGNGKVTTNLIAGTSTEVAQDLAIEANGNLVLAGHADVDPGAGFTRDFALARYNGSNGSLDDSFGGDGTITTALAPGTNDDLSRAVAIQTDGRIVAAGQATPGVSAENDIALARYFEPAQTPTPPRCGGKSSTKVGTSGPDVLIGTPAADVIAGLRGRDRLVGKGRGDRLCGGAGRDRLIGGRGRDRLFGGPGRDRLRGGPGRDFLRGGPGRDRLIGGPGRDRQRQ